MSGLRIARGLALPEDSVTKTFAILAQRRQGKTYTASVIAEEMVRVGLPWVALDPTGAWWGLRAGADGSEKGGLRVYVFGGDHGDLPLERTAGKQIADLVVEHPGHYVLDFSHFESKEAERQLATDFAERFYRRKGRAKAPMHLFVDEADMFAPQRIPSGDQRMLGAFESIVRRGGIRGIGSTLISQRAAVVNKNVLEQIDVLITLRVVGPNDQKAIKAYVDSHGDPRQQAEMLDSLSGLALGEAWIWEPGADVFERVKVRTRRTFNSSATPDGRTEDATGLVDVDLDALRGKLDAAIEAAKRDDPKELRKQLAAERRRADRLDHDLANRPAAEPVEVPVLANGAVESLNDAIGAIHDLAEKLGRTAGEIGQELAKAQGSRQREERRTGAKVPGAVTRRPAAAPLAAEGDVKLKAGARRMLASLAMLHPTPLSRIQVATLSDISPKSGTFSDYLSAIKSAGLAHEDSRGVALTASGSDLLAGDLGSGAPSPDALRAMWGRKLKAGARRMLDALMEVHPDGLTRDELAERTDISRTSGTFSDYLSKLRSNALARERDGEVYAGDALFLGSSR